MTTKQKIINSQKATADYVYSLLKVIDPWCILAGGAPRDWYLGEPCNDLDFYFCSTASTLSTVQEQLAAMFGEDVFVAKRKHICGSYKHMESLKRIFDGELNGVKVQLMQLHTTGQQWSVVDSFSTSICKATYINGVIDLHRDFELTLATDIMFLSEGYTWEDFHPAKLKERYKGAYLAGNKPQAEKEATWKLLKLIREPDLLKEIKEKMDV